MADPKDLARAQPQAGQLRDWSGALGSVTDAAPAGPAPAATVEDAGFMGSALYEKGKTVHNKRIDGPFRRFKWLVMLVTLAIYYITPWIRWDRGPYAPDQAVLDRKSVV